ncbi:hypothetical protein AAVH_43691, partial [Aphelenchoides avenae]
QPIAIPPATQPLRTTVRSIQVEAQPSSSANEDRNNREKASHLAHAADDSLQAGFGGAYHPAHTAGGMSPAKCGAGTSDVNLLTDQAILEPKAVQRDGPVSELGARREAPIQPTIAPVEAHREALCNVTAPASGPQQQPASELHRSACAFCSHPGHRSTHCLNYGTFEKRLLRAARQSICASCCSLQPEPHLWKACPHEPLLCGHCKQKGHHQAFCRAWLRIFSNRISRRRPQTINRKNSTRGRSTSTHARACSRRTAEKPCQQRRCNCHRVDCKYVISLPWKTTIQADSDVAALPQAANTLNVTPSPTTPYVPSLRAEQSKPQAPPIRADFATSATATVSDQRSRRLATARTSTATRPTRESIRASMYRCVISACERCGYSGGISEPLRVGADGTPFHKAVPRDFAASPVRSWKYRPTGCMVGRLKHLNDEDEFCRPNPPLSVQEQRALDAELAQLSEEEGRALDAALDSDNESYHTYDSSYAATPCARPHSPSGGFGPYIGREDEAAEDLEPTAADENYWPDKPISTATFTTSSWN